VKEAVEQLLRRGRVKEAEGTAAATCAGAEINNRTFARVQKVELLRFCQNSGTRLRRNLARRRGSGDTLLQLF